MRNNWEYYEYFWGNRDVTNKITKVKVKWANGKEEVYNAIWKKKAVSYTDTGHTYYTNRYELYIAVEFNGFLFHFDLYNHLNTLNVTVEELE